MAEVGLLPFARIALQVSRAVLPRYRSRFSKHQFTQPQLLAVLCLMRYADWTFREAEVRLSEHRELRPGVQAGQTGPHRRSPRRHWRSTRRRSGARRGTAAPNGRARWHCRAGAPKETDQSLHFHVRSRQGAWKSKADKHPERCATVRCMRKTDFRSCRAQRGPFPCLQ
jgi:hypothetical protein